MRIANGISNLIVAIVAAFAVLAAEPAKPDPKDRPKIIVAGPLGLKPGKPTKLLLRGLKLDEATEIRLHDPKGSAKILSKGKAPVNAKEKDSSAATATRKWKSRRRPPPTTPGRRSISASSRRPASRRRTP